MPEIRVQDEQGNIHVFPDGSTPDMIAKALNVKAPNPANPYGLSAQDFTDLKQIRAAMPAGDPRAAKVDTLLGSQSQTLAQKVRAKFPGVYDDLSDSELEQKVIAKYPQYADMQRTQPLPQFDVNAARQAGATDDQILSYLAQRSPNFDLQAALKQSSKADIINYLSTHASPPNAAQTQQQQPSFAERLVSAYNPGATEFADKHPILGPAVRFLDAAGGAMLGIPSSLYHAAADPLTPQEEQEFQGHTRIPGEVAVERLTGGPLVRGAQAYANPETRPTFKQAMSVLPEALGQGTGSYVGSELVGAGVKTAAKPLASLLEKSASAQYLKALAPTKARNKVLAQKVTPELINRGVSGSLEGIKGTAQANLDDIGPQIDQAINDPVRAHLYNAIPQAKQLAIQPVLDALESYKQEGGMVNGVKVDPDLVNKATKLQRIVSQLGPDVSYESLNRVRRIWDAKVAKAGGYAGQSLAEGSMVDAMREGANAIRSELAKDRPDIAKLNSEYSFWSKVNQVVGDTIQRRSGQEGAVMPKLAGIGGAATGHTPMGVAMYGLGRIIQSPRWRTFSAIKKTQIANAIAAGDAATLTKLVGVAASTNGTQQEQ